MGPGPMGYSAAKAWLQAKAAHDEAHEKLVKARKLVLKLADDASCQGAGFCVTRYFKAGSIDYGKIPELRSVDLDAYCKAGHWESRVTEQGQLAD
jgi:hypothetical protein